MHYYFVFTSFVCVPDDELSESLNLRVVEGQVVRKKSSADIVNKGGFINSTIDKSLSVFKFFCLITEEPLV